MKKDENGVVLPVKSTRAPAESVPPVRLENNDNYNNERSDSGEAKQPSEENKKPIDKEEIAKARKTLNDYLASKKSYDERVKSNYEWFNLQYADKDGGKEFYEDDDGNTREKLIPDSRGAQCLNVIMNKHADAMDNYPEPICLARSADDKETAELLSSVVPCILERCGFYNTYSLGWYDKLIAGVAIYATTWDSGKDKGLGDVSIKVADVLSIAWQPHIENIQDSKNVFYIKMYDIDEIKEMYPDLEDVSAESLGLTEHKTFDTEPEQYGKVSVIDWYYKKNGQVHFCKFCGENVLESTENDGGEGLYDHGEYPFDFDVLFPLKGTPVGFGMVDVVKNPQRYLDIMKKDFVTNIKVNSQPRNIVNANCGINLDDLADLRKQNIASDNIDCLRPIQAQGLANGALSVYQRLEDEIKETSGTNDASSGASAAGVTSGSAIAALQEAGGKISRDMNKSMYQTTFTSICYKIIELIRQFYNLPRFFRIVGEDKKEQFIEFDNSSLMKQATEFQSGEEVLQRLPIFDIRVKAQKSSPFATAANNEMMMNLFNMGAFNPNNAEAALIMLEGMTFEGKDNIVTMIEKNQNLQQTVQELYNKNQMLNAMLAGKNAEQAGTDLYHPPPSVQNNSTTAV